MKLPFRQKTHRSTPSSDGVFLIVGLGNPGREYEATRHNVGFMIVDHLHRQWGGGAWRSKFSALISEVQVAQKKVVFIKPQTFMNLSGQAVVQAQLFFKVPLEHILVIHDELDLKPGQVKSKMGGGDAGHNGLKSITRSVGNGYVRFRVGIGHPRDEAPDMFHNNPHAVADYVLQPLGRKALDGLDQIAQDVALKTEELILGSTQSR